MSFAVASFFGLNGPHGQTRLAPLLMRIFYSGITLSGRRTTLRALAKPISPPLADVQIRCEDTGALWRESLVRSPVDGTIDAQGLFLRDAHAVVVVVDSQLSRLQASVEHLARLRAGLVDIGREPETLPIVFQCNKRDLPEVASEAQLRSALEWPHCVYVESVARTGAGVVEALRTAISLVALPKP